MPKLIAIDPFNRIEGDLRVEISIEDKTVTDAKSSGILFRGFERILVGRDPLDALVVTPRICGICSASHGIAAAKALAQSMTTDMPPNGYYVRNIILGTEVVMSHLSHFFFLYAPDFTNVGYRDLPFHDSACRRFTPLKGSSVTRAVGARQSALEIMGLVAGKWPNSLAVHPGGTTSTMNLSSLTRAVGILREFQIFLERSFLGCSIDKWLDIDRFERLEEWLGTAEHRESDLGFFINSSFRLGLDRIGRGPGRFLSYGAYDLPGGGTWLPSGFYDGMVRPFDQEHILEHIASSFFRDAVEARHPLQGVTNPLADKKDAYSWSKAPRYKGKTVEVGPLARLLIAGDPLLHDTVEKLGISVFSRMLARLQEMIKLVRQMAIWLESIKPNEAFYSGGSSRYREVGIGLTEAARGALGHWMRTSSSFVENYQVVTPSAWNMSPRDDIGQPGPVEEALLHLEVSDPDNPVEVNHVIRSFDPCMSCTGH